MKLLLTLCCTFFLATVSFAQAGKATGQVTFIRNNQVADLKLNKVFMDDEFLCKIAEHGYFVREVPVGNHSFSVQFNGKTAKKKAEKLYINVKPGKKYFVEVIFQDKWPIPNVYCIEVTESSAARVLPSLKESSRCEDTTK